MDLSFEPLGPTPRFQCATECKATTTPRRPSRGPQRLFSSLKGFVRRSSRSTPLSTSQISAPSPPISSLRMSSRNQKADSRTLRKSKSLGSLRRPPVRKTQRGNSTPEEFLTMAELENIWGTQDASTSPIVAPNPSLVTADKVEPVEAPTNVKHQLDPELPRTSFQGRQSPSNNSSSLQSQRSSPVSFKSATTPGSSWYSHQSTPESLPPTPPAKDSMYIEPKDEYLRPVPLKVRKTDRQLPAPLNLSSARSTHETRGGSTSDIHDTAAGRDPSPPPAYSPSIYSRATHSRPSSYERTETPLSEVRNAVVSGVVHPAFRPLPYFPQHPAPQSCRVTSRYAVPLHTRNWSYGRV